ncbi:ProQ/FINO family protein [Marinomonas sp. 2405UD68-3]|uniref:ProQ/FINO family protein n=1 Tax=Marinomonas sp. 2405UD68-3 TaxID=3391835 RepID=UPI0039C9C8C6
MDQLIQRLQEKIAILIHELDEARAQIATLKQTDPDTNFSAFPYSETQSPYDLLSQISDLKPNDKLQLYIEDSLDIDSSDTLNATNSAGSTQNTTNVNPSETDEQSTQTPFTENAFAIENQVILEDLSPAEPTVIETTPAESTPVESVIDTPSAETQKVEPHLTPPESTTPETEQATTAQPRPKKRNKNKQNNLKLIQLLEKKYPKAFNWSNPSPLKIGIDKEMQIDEELTESKLKRALAAYTRSDRYKKSLAKQKIRIDLNGNPVLPKKITNRPTDTKPSNNKYQKQPKAQFKEKEVKEKETKAEAPQHSGLSDEAQHSGLSDEERMQKKLALLLTKK